MSAREYIFSLMDHVRIEIINYEKIRKEKDVLNCASILILKISQNPRCDITIEIVILHGLNLTDLECQ